MSRFCDCDIESDAEVAPLIALGDPTIEMNVRARKIDVLVHHIENDRDPARVSGVDQALQSVGPTEVSTWRKVINGTISPIKIELVDLGEGTGI